jgi:hypothetical protein
VEKVFGWGKQARPVKQMKLRGVRRVDWLFRLVMAAHNLLRLQKLIPAQLARAVVCPGNDESLGRTVAGTTSARDIQKNRH